jgi:hypothetical protein
MRNARNVLLPLIAILAFSSGAIATPQTPSRPAKPSPVSRPPARAVTAPTANDPFIGAWKLNAGKSKYQSGGAPTSFTRTYEDRGGGTIFMTTDVTIPQGSARAYLVYRRDGKPYPEAEAGAQAIRMVSVTAIDPRTESVSIIVDGKASETPSTITISADGMTMTQVVSGRDAKGKAFTNSIVYDKQP